MNRGLFGRPERAIHPGVSTRPPWPAIEWPGDFCAESNSLNHSLAPQAAIPNLRSASFIPMTRIDRLIRLGLTLTAAGALSLTGCSATKDAATGVGEAAKDAATATGEAAKDAATATGQAALAPAVNPVLDLLRKGESELKAGNTEGAVATMGGFKSVWEKAAPVIQPLAGDKWPAIETGANTVLSTFGGGASPDAGAAGSALSGLIGPLSGLIGQ
jgi:hypothetical protein